MIKLSEIFKIIYPPTNTLKDQVLDDQGINFVSAKASNNGVSARIRINPEFEVYPSYSISVPLKGSVLEASLQIEDFQSAHQVAILIPKKDLDVYSLLFYCLCIRKNKFKFNYGRQADRTFKDLLIPEVKDIPQWVKKTDVKKEKLRRLIKYKPTNKSKNKKSNSTVSLDTLFEVNYGNGLAEKSLKKSKDGINFIARKSTNNAVSSQVEVVKGEKIYKKNQLTFSAGGSVGSTFLQPKDFYTAYHIFVLQPKKDMSIEELLYYATCLEKNKFKFNYGRQANRSLPKLKIPDYDSIPEWIQIAFNEKYNDMEALIKRF